MEHGSNFSIKNALGASPPFSQNVDLRLGIAFNRNGELYLFVSRKTLRPEEDTEFEKHWMTVTQNELGNDFCHLTLTDTCRVRVPESRLNLHDRGKEDFLGHIGARIPPNEGDAYRFLIEIEAFEKEDTTAIIATRLTLSDIRSE